MSRTFEGDFEHLLKAIREWPEIGNPMTAKNTNEKLSWLFQQYGIVAIKDKSATAFLTLRWTFPAKRACVATDTEPDRLAALGKEVLSSSKPGVDPRLRPLDPGQDQFCHGIAVALDHHHVAVAAHTAISQEPEIGLGIPGYAPW